MHRKHGGTILTFILHLKNMTTLKHHSENRSFLYHVGKICVGAAFFIMQRLHYFLPFLRRMRVKRHGVLLTIEYGAGSVDRHIAIFGVWEAAQIDFLFDKIKELHMDIFIDVGSFCGLYSLIAAHRGLCRDVHALEPSPKNYERLLANVKQNDFSDKITCHNLAASDTTATYSFRDLNDGSKIESSETISDKNAFTMRAAPLDSLFDYRGRKLAFKIDVESHELSVLRGAKSLFANNDILLQVEIFPDNIKVVQYLIEEGFEIFHKIENDYYFKK